MCRKLVYLAFFGMVLIATSPAGADSNLVAHYEFEAVGDFSNSLAGGTAGQPQGDTQVIWGDGRGSYVLSLDGDGDYVSYGDGWTGIVGDAITVVAWIQTDTLASYDTVAALGYAWRLYGGLNGNVIFQCSDTIPNPSSATGAVNVNDGKWHHVAGTYDGAKYTLYVDGILDASMDATGKIDAGGSYVGCIGAHYKKNDDRDPRRFFDGLIDDVRIYNKALSAGEVRQIFTFKPGRASQPRPSDGEKDVARDGALIWSPAETAVQHDVYFGADFNDVNQADVSDATGVYRGRQDPNSYTPAETLVWETTYYWRIDEVNDAHPDSPWKGSVWSFTVGNYLIVDDFEHYDTADNGIWYTWKDGLGYGTPGTEPYYPGNGTGSAVGEETTGTIEPIIAHGGIQSMPYYYDNNKQGFAKYSEAQMTLNSPRNWTQEGIIELSLWFIGRPAYVGGFTEALVGTYTMTSSGTDIWGNADQFHYAFKMLSGPGSIVAKVESISKTNDWTKAGVMIRETLDPASKHAMAAVTPGNGVWFGWRPAAADDSFSQKQVGIVAPHWVKLERGISGDFTAYHSTDGATWQGIGSPQNMKMDTKVYIGLALTSHDADLTCDARFSNVTMTGTVDPQWAHQDIGIASNDPEPLYVAVSNLAGAPAVVYHEDPNAAMIETWTQWVIPLQTFADQGVNLTDVDRIAIGFGTRGNMTVPGGSGKAFFDDIRLCRPRSTP